MTAPAVNDAFTALLEYLKRSRGFDFTGYKPTSLERRICKRMEAVNVESFEDYVDYLEVHPDEFVHLFNTILINVTSFFRDPPAWDYLAREVLPRLLAERPSGEPIRVWSAGCASGQEAYTLAILLAEALGTEAFRERVKIYGTDVDLDALNQARHASYSAREVEDVPPELLAKYFEPAGDRYLFLKDLRRGVIFGRHDLIQDAPISRLDLLVCRNTLMYFNAETQARVLNRFHFAVNDGGCLFLGKAEMLLAQNGNAFVPVDLKRRLFAKEPAANARPRLPGLPRFNGQPGGPLLNHVRLRDAAFDAGPLPRLVTDPAGLLALANQQARAQFGLTLKDLGRPFWELDTAFLAELRVPVDRAAAQRQAVVLKEVEWRRPGGDAEYFEIQIIPLVENGDGLLGTLISFTSVTATRRLQDELQRTNVELESAYEELQSANEELETTNEELQSSSEELETTNEELHSTNEELETMNEELQSANEELQTMNEELRQRSEELNDVNSFLESILASFRGAVVVLDRDLLVMIWNHRAEELWGLREDEARGKHFFNLDIGLPVEQLRQSIRAGQAGDARPPEVVVEAVNRRGKAFRCCVNCAPLLGTSRETRGVILLMGDDAEAGRPF
jgi:two-component system CheB/CheR fusion protein